MSSLRAARTPVRLIVAVFVLGFCCRWCFTAEPVAEGRRPRLAVLVVVDQLRGDYIERWGELFGEGGFRRMQTEGAWFQNCHYPYAFTMTAPGHASVVTGCSPDKHGIVANDWFDRAAGKSVYCVASNRHGRVPPAPANAENSPLGEKSGGMSPERLLVPTLADALKGVADAKARVVSLSFKERSAILMGGRQPDACYWFDTSAGTVVTSTYYRDRLHPWVEAFNRDAVRDRWFGKDWSRLRSDLDYAKHSSPDDVRGEGTGSGQSRTFPHPMTGGAARPGTKYYEALYNSPFGNELLFELALKAIDAERLGTGDATDLLCVSFSSSDIVGHCWGPDSQEVLDVTLRMDDVLRRLLDHLDAKVGKGRYVLVLTADHGICPLPEVSQAQGKDAGRVPSSLLAGRAEDFLRAQFGKATETGRWVEGSAYPWIYLNQTLIRQRGLNTSDIEDVLSAWLKKQPGVLTAYGQHELKLGPAKNDRLGEQVRKSLHPDRCGDVAVVTKPLYLLTSSLTGTSHGTPHPYDTHVPLLVYGPGVRVGVRKERVSPQSVAAILAHATGVNPPCGAEAGVPEGLFPGQGAPPTPRRSLPRQ
jgi:hypothetical protein